MATTTVTTAGRFVRAATVDVGEVLGIGPANVPLRTATVRVGSWDPPTDGAVVPTLPLLVGDGGAQRPGGGRGREGADLLGPGDLLRLEAEDGGFMTRF